MIVYVCTRVCGCEVRRCTHLRRDADFNGSSSCTEFFFFRASCAAVVAAIARGCLALLFPLSPRSARFASLSSCTLALRKKKRRHVSQGRVCAALWDFCFLCFPSFFFFIMFIEVTRLNVMCLCASLSLTSPSLLPAARPPCQHFRLLFVLCLLAWLFVDVFELRVLLFTFLFLLSWLEV